MQASGRLFIAAAAAALFLLPTLAEARGFGFARGRTKAIKTQLAKKINARRMMHVPRIKPSDLRIRTRVAKTPPGRRYIIGSQHRNVKWKIKSNILRGTAKSFTPIVPNGGRHTSIGQFRITVAPRGGLKPPAARR